MNEGTRHWAACLWARTGPEGKLLLAAMLAAFMTGCAGVHDDAPVVRQVRPGDYRAATTARPARPSRPAPAYCVFTPSHGMASGETVPPSYACIRLSQRQYAAGHCAEVAGYERDDGIFMPGHTRCLVDPLTPGLSDQTPVASASAVAPAPVPGSAPPPTPMLGAPASASTSASLSSTASGRTLPSATTVPGMTAAARSSAEAAHSVVRRRGSELVLPTGDPTGVDQGNGTFVSPIQAPGDVSNRAY